MSDKTSIGDRMKRYETVPRTSLTPRMPMIIRVDGRAFHTYTKALKRDAESPWNWELRDALTAAAKALVDEIAGAKLAYLQSDEISVLVTDYDSLTVQAWFNGVAQKICSVTASIATAAFNRWMVLGGGLSFSRWTKDTNLVTFDSRCFVVPKEDVCNYFVWREQDATRNSVSMLAQHHFDHAELQGKSWGTMQEMLHSEKGINWNDCDVWQKRGWCVDRSGVVNWDIPIFTKDRDFIESCVFLDDDERGSVE